MTTTAPALTDLIATLAAHGAMFDGGSDASRADIAADWDDHDFDAASARRWMDAGYWDAGTAAEARDAGYTPRTVLTFPAGHKLAKSGMDPIYAACNGDIALAKLVAE